MEKNTASLVCRTPKTPKTYPRQVSGVLGVTHIGETEKIPAFARMPTIAVSAAAQRAGKSPDTIVRWCKDHLIGKQLGRKNPWRVDPLGLEILMAGDGEALAAYRAGNFNHSSMMTYRERLRRYDPR